WRMALIFAHLLTILLRVGRSDNGPAGGGGIGTDIRLNIPQHPRALGMGRRRCGKEGESEEHGGPSWKPDHRAPSFMLRFEMHSRIFLSRSRSRRGRSLSNAARHIASRSPP